MRLWDYRLLKVLPDKFIISQWRECIAIKRQWEKGTLKHRLVSYVMDYDRSYFYNYVIRVCNELFKRRIKYRSIYKEEIRIFCGGSFINECYPEHNNRYLKQCLCNLQEKYDDLQSKMDKANEYIDKEIKKIQQHEYARGIRRLRKLEEILKEEI